MTDIVSFISDRENDTIMHYGVKGMKWGIRKDRRMGRRRRSYGITETQKKPRSGTGLDALTNEQLRTTIDRLRLETDYNRLVSDIKRQNRTAGQKIIQNLKEDAVSTARDIAKTAAKTYGLKALNVQQTKQKK